MFEVNNFKQGKSCLSGTIYGSHKFLNYDFIWCDFSEGNN